MQLCEVVSLVRAMLVKCSFWHYTISFSYTEKKRSIGTSPVYNISSKCVISGDGHVGQKLI
jgi:hypothetical protein